MGVIGDLNRYTQFKTANAIGDAVTAALKDRQLKS